MILSNTVYTSPSSLSLRYPIAIHSASPFSNQQPHMWCSKICPYTTYVQKRRPATVASRQSALHLYPCRSRYVLRRCLSINDGGGLSRYFILRHRLLHERLDQALHVAHRFAGEFRKVRTLC